jgi:hypothetical protein
VHTEARVPVTEQIDAGHEFSHWDYLQTIF